MSTVAEVLAWTVLATLLLLVAVATPALVHRATVHGLNSRHLPASPEPTEQERRAQMADDFTHFADEYGNARMAVYDPSYDWPADPGAVVADLRDYGASKKRGDR